MAQVIYNGVAIDHPQVDNIEITPQFDAEGNLLEGLLFQFSATGFIFHGGRVAGFPHTTTEAAKRATALEAIAWLTQPRCKFQFVERNMEVMEVSPTAYNAGGYQSVNHAKLKAGKKGDAEMVESEDSGVSQNATALGQDLLWGPKTTASIIRQWPGGIIQVRFTLVAFLNPPLVWGQSDAPDSKLITTRKGKNVLSYTSSVSYTIDQNHYTTRIVDGAIKIRGNRYFDADEVRGLIYSTAPLPTGVAGVTEPNFYTEGVPLPDGFVRQGAAYRIDQNRNTIYYQIIDKEVYATPPWPATDCDAQLEVVSYGFDVSTTEKRLTGWVSGNRDTPKTALVVAVLRILERNFLLTRYCFVTYFKLVDFLYDSRIAFVVEALEVLALHNQEMTPDTVGLLRTPATDKQHWMQEARGTAGLKGSGYALKAPAKKGQEPIIAKPKYTPATASPGELSTVQSWEKIIPEIMRTGTSAPVYSTMIKDQGISLEDFTRFSAGTGERYLVLKITGVYSVKDKNPAQDDSCKERIAFRTRYNEKDYAKLNDMKPDEALKQPITGKVYGDVVSQNQSIQSAMDTTTLNTVTYRAVIVIHPRQAAAIFKIIEDAKDFSEVSSKLGDKDLGWKVNAAPGGGEATLKKNLFDQLNQGGSKK